MEEEEELEEFVRGLFRIAFGATPFPILKLELGGLTEVAVSREGCFGCVEAMEEFEGDAVREGGDEASCEGRPRLREEDLELEGATSRRTALTTRQG